MLQKYTNYTLLKNVFFFKGSLVMKITVSEKTQQTANKKTSCKLRKHFNQNVNMCAAFYKRAANTENTYNFRNAYQPVTQQNEYVSGGHSKRMEPFRLLNSMQHKHMPVKVS